MPAFIETQFPIARLSAEAYKERKAVAGQTLNGVGKWWGRKPLILCRAAIIGMLMPASSDAKRDREIFLKILTMDDEGTWHRQTGDIPVAAWRAAASPEIQLEYFTARGFQSGMSDEEKDEVRQRIWDELDEEQRAALDAERRRPVVDRAVFDAMTYAYRIEHCDRPENVTGPRPEAWAEINAHLGTNAYSLPQLVEELGQRAFGHKPRVGDSFCGGGSIPFEAARIGCEAFGSDLNPVAALLTWASLNLLDRSPDEVNQLRGLQADAIARVDETLKRWGIEHNESGERADAYLYCVEVKPEGSNYYIPVAPVWTVADRFRVITRWRRDESSDHLLPEVVQVSPEEYAEYKKGKGATFLDGRVVDPFDPSRSWSIEALRGPEGLRRWTNEDVVPRPDDVLQERLYCIRWVKTVRERGKPKIVRRYAAPDAADVEREAKVLDLLRERFAAWQREGFIPSKSIPEDGDKTDEPIRTRGWTHWHHLFTPRQLLLHGLILEQSVEMSGSRLEKVFSLLVIGRLANWNSKLSRWLQSQSGGNGGGKDTFFNQALNPLYNFSVRPLSTIHSAAKVSFPQVKQTLHSATELKDARDVQTTCDVWITDPPYADAINYHELTDFFLAWYEKQIISAFPSWIADSRADLAVRGSGEDFRRSMVEIYKNLARHTPDNGMQVVMFTHQDPAVWADLGMILWAAGLKATAAWTISTETSVGGIKSGNYVQGTVCLVLRKRTVEEPGFLDEVYPLVEDEVRRQIDFMQALDEGGEPNFNDADYQLAAYAAALKVLTQYATLDGRDVEHEVFAVRAKGEVSDFQGVIERALGIACNLLVPRGLDAVWRDLTQVERYYLRGLDIESRGERRQGMYEELARGFGVNDIKPLLKSDKANGARVHTPSGLGNGTLAQTGEGGGDTSGLPTRRGRASASGPHPFAVSPLRHLLFAVRETAANDSPEPGRQYLRDTFGRDPYWTLRTRFLGLLDWLAALGNAEGMEEWQGDSEAARLLAGRLKNDEA
jgi:putative DNA methylase